MTLETIYSFNSALFKAKRVDTQEEFTIQISFNRDCPYTDIRRWDKDNRLVEHRFVHAIYNIKIESDVEELGENEIAFAIRRDGDSDYCIYKTDSKTMAQVFTTFNNALNLSGDVNEFVKDLTNGDFTFKPIYVDYAGLMNISSFIIRNTHEIIARLNSVLMCRYISQISKAKNFDELMGITEQYIEFSKSSKDEILKYYKKHPDKFQMDEETYQTINDFKWEDDALWQ